MSDENWRNLTHQKRDELLAAIQAAGVDCTDKWLSEAALEAIGKLRAKVAKLRASASLFLRLYNADEVVPGDCDDLAAALEETN